MRMRTCDVHASIPNVLTAYALTDPTMPTRAVVILIIIEWNGAHCDIVQHSSSSVAGPGWLCIGSFSEYDYLFCSFDAASPYFGEVSLLMHCRMYCWLFCFSRFNANECHCTNNGIQTNWCWLYDARLG